MECKDIRLLLEANSDGELDPVRQLELQAHLRACPACALLAKGLDARRDALRDLLPRHGATPQFRGKIQALYRPRAMRRRAPFGWQIMNLGGLGASLALAVLVGYSWGTSRSRTNGLFDEAISEHVRSLQAGHLVDVMSTDQHTVKPWFIGRLDFSPPVVDLADAGFPLAGGRLETIDGRPAAALVFHRRLHSVNLFIWPTGGSAVPVHSSAEKGYNAESWTQGGLNFLAVSEIPAGELDQFAEEFRGRTK